MSEIEAPPVSPNPFGADAPTEDRTVQALWAMGSGAGAVVVWFGVLTFLTTLLNASSTAKTAADVNPSAFYVNFIIYGSVIGVAFGGVVSWMMMAGIPSSYRRGGLSLVAAFAGAVVAGSLTVMVKQLAGSFGLLGVAGVALLITIFLMQRTRRARAAV